MANIRPYDPGQMANRVVGTPGIDPSAGKAAEGLAQGASQARNELASQANQNAGALGTILGAVGKAAGVIAGDALATKKAAKLVAQKQIAEAQLASDAYNFAQNAAATKNEYILKHKDDPENLVPSLQKYMDDSKKAGLSKYANDPVQLAKAEAKYDEVTKTVMEQADDKSYAMQDAQASVMIPNMVSTATQQIRTNSGTIDDRIQGYAEQTKILSDGINRMRTLRGSAQTKADLYTANRSTAAELMGSLVNNRPDNPVASMQQLTQAGRMLQGSIAMKAFLTEEDKHKFEGQINAGIDNEVKNLRTQTAVNTTGFALEMLTKMADLDLHRGEPEVQNKFVLEAKAQLDVLKADADRMAKDQNLPPEARLIGQQSNEAQAREIDAGIRRAQAHLDYQQALSRQDASEARRIKSEEDAKVREAKREAKEALGREKADAIGELRAQRDAMKELMLEDAVGNREAIIKAGGEVMQKAQLIAKAYPEASGEVSRATREAMGAATLAANKFERAWYDFPGKAQDALTSVSNGFRQDAPAVQRRTQYIGAMKQFAGGMEDSAKLEKGSAIMNLTPQQSEYASKQFDAWNAANPNALASIKQQMQTGIQQIAKTKFPAKEQTAGSK